MRASLQLRIAFVVGLVVFCAAAAAGFFVRLELLDGDANAATAIEYGELLALLAPFAVAAPVAAFAAARWTLRPLERIEGDARAVSPEYADRRLSEERAPSEVLGLVHAVNGALDRMAEAYDFERKFTADAAHALRTPLTVLSLRLQRECDEGRISREAYIEDLDRLRRVVDQLLSLKGVEEANFRDSEAVDLSKVSRLVAAELLPAVNARRREIEVNAASSLVGIGDEHAIVESVRNLVQNAILHGHGTIRIDTGKSEGQVWLAVSDEGLGPPASLLKTSFERFVRGDGSRGSGLGLSIARDAVMRAGGSLEWCGGSKIKLTLEEFK